ncbi:hypothetical protein IWW36_002413 [Coemansia brasiliensis]|uniref:BTB domain-containing protein n=1 Tax=Coemansia brasiliensis TaxID=2650707 RepID=A0A9W8I754_9FUNG|nr:hypothetical protein IWW36_002413 [Coemansia brasiliensis]
MPAVENDLTELFIRSFKCTGDVPPALVGSSVTYLNGHAYVFGGRALHSGKLSNDVYVCDLRAYQWRRIESPEAASGQRQPALQDVVAAPSPRFFHSATAFKHYLVVFGGMGLDIDPDAPTPNSTQSKPRSSNLQDDKNQQSFQVRSSKTLLGDIGVFDTKLEQWVARRALDASSEPTRAQADVDEAGNSTQPSPRYAHLSTLFGSRLLVVGGQDLEEQYVEELNVFDLQLGRWVLRSPFPRAVGLYRSFIANVPSTGSTLLYSNYSFASVKRALYLLSAPPDCTLKEISDQLDGEPPGLRFPRGHIVDPQTIVMSGTLISTEGHSEMSLWALNTSSLRWQPVNCGAKFRAGSWNQSIVDPRTNTLVVFGDSRRDLTYDYQRRRLNYSEIRTVDLRALGFLRASQPPELPLAISPSPVAASRTASGTLSQQQQQQVLQGSGVKSSSDILGFEIGSQLLHFALFSDAEIVASDGNCVAMVNSGLLHKRWPAQAQTWQAAAGALASTSSASSIADSGTGAHRRTDSQQTGGRPESSLLSGGYDDEESELDTSGAAKGQRRYFIDGTREAIYLLVFYLYTGIVDPTARFGLHQGAEIAAASDDQLSAVRVLGDLMVVARKYSLNPLALRLVSLLRWQVSESNAPLIFEAALRAEHQGLQARCVIAIKDTIGRLKMDRGSTLYMIGSASRASLLRFFPRLAADNTSGFSDDAQAAAAFERANYPNSSGYASNSMTQEMRQHHELRQRSTSDVLLASELTTANGGSRSGAFPSPSSASSSPASSLRGNSARSPYQHELPNPRRPWEATMMASPVINSPASSRFSNQSPEIRSDGNKRMSGIMHLATQPLPEDAAISYTQDQSNVAGSEPSQQQQQQQSQSSHSSKRVSRYLGGIAGGAAASSAESVTNERRTSDSSSSNDQPSQSQQHSSSRSFFRPWSKVKKLTSSNQVSTDSLPPVPSHASTYSANSSQ